MLKRRLRRDDTAIFNEFNQPISRHRIQRTRHIGSVLADDLSQGINSGWNSTRIDQHGGGGGAWQLYGCATGAQVGPQAKLPCKARTLTGSGFLLCGKVKYVGQAVTIVGNP